MKSRNELQVIEAATFYEGMRVDSEIYYQYNGSYILLCKNVTLTHELIMRLRQCEDANQNIYVRTDRYAEIVRKSGEHRAALDRRLGIESPPPPPPPAPAPKPEPKPAPYIPLDPGYRPEQADRHLSDLQKKIKAQKEYQEITQHTTAMLGMVAATNRVPRGMADHLTGNVHTRMRQTDVSTLLQCINSLRKMDDYLYAHSTNVALLNGLIGGWLGLDDDEITALIRAGLLHDLGKLKVPEEILNKPAKLTREEFDVVKLHPLDSYEILLASGERDARVLDAARNHHERMNGTGYPDGLKAEDIPLCARITAVSDVYDAMVAKRPYRERSSPFDILAEFAMSRFSNLDMRIVDEFLKNMPSELMGKRVVLSDGRVAKVVYINPSNFAYPIVKIGGKLVTTNPSLKCVAMDNFVSLLPD